MWVSPGGLTSKRPHLATAWAHHSSAVESSSVEAHTRPVPAVAQATLGWKLADTQQTGQAVLWT